MTTLLGSGGLDTGERVLFQQTVPRQLVRQAAVSEVFVTDIRRTGEDTFLAGVQWPRAHILLAPPASPWYDPLLLVTSIRQAGLAIAHEAYGLTHGDKPLWHALSYATDADGLLRGDRPVDVVIAVTIRDVKRRGTGVAGTRMEFDCYRDGRLIGRCACRWSRVSPATYTRLRGGRQGGWRGHGRLAPPVRPELVGRPAEADVLLAASPSPGVCSLRVDTGNPALFDHPVDHVPGLVIMDAARQAALLVTGRPDALPVRGEFTFSRYIEFGEPCTMRAEPAPADGDVTVHFDQCGQVAATATLGVR